MERFRWTGPGSFIWESDAPREEESTESIGDLDDDLLQLRVLFIQLFEEIERLSIDLVVMFGLVAIPRYR